MQFRRRRRSNLFNRFQLLLKIPIAIENYQAPH